MELLGIIFVCIVLMLGFSLRSLSWPNWQDPQSTSANAETVQAYEVRAGLFVNRSELALFTALNRHKPYGLHVMAKVRLEDILRVGHSIKDGRLRWQYRGRIKSRHVDFVLCDAAGRFLCAVELDGSSHINSEAEMVDGFKDAIFKHAGLQLFRIQVGDNFDRVSRNLWEQLA